MPCDTAKNDFVQQNLFLPSPNQTKVQFFLYKIHKSQIVNQLKI
jgi:hypothetical protein